MEWIIYDKGTAPKQTEFGEIKYLEGLGTIGDFLNLTVAIEHVGSTEAKIRKCMGENGSRVLKEVWEV
jgi:membrane dipeptidase